MSDRVHQIKTDPTVWDALKQGVKTAEFRRDDRGYQVGDLLHLVPWSEELGYARGVVIRRVTHIVRGPAFDIPDGYVMMSLARLGES